MRRPVRPRATFTADLRDHAQWVARHRSLSQVVRMRDGLRSFRKRVADFPGIGRQIALIGTISFRVARLAPGLPYLVWYAYDLEDPAAPIWLARLFHEAQDREFLEHL